MKIPYNSFDNVKAVHLLQNYNNSSGLLSKRAISTTSSKEHNSSFKFHLQLQQMVSLYLLMYFSCILTLFSEEIGTTAYTLQPSQAIIDGKTLVSEGGVFELGFFSPSLGSKNRYLGIWYKAIPVQTVVWVANRNSPLTDTSGVLKISGTGNLVIKENRTESVIWASNSTVDNPILEFLQSGNLVLRDVKNGDPSGYYWQSFDHPGDTLLPGMKIEKNFRTGVYRSLLSWKSIDDPSPGDFTFGCQHGGYLESGINYGSKKYYRGGSWNGIRDSGAPELKPNPLFTYEVVQSSEDVYYSYKVLDESIIMRMVLVQTNTEARVQRLTWANRTGSWVVLLTLPRDRCDYYGLCNAYSTCDVTNVAPCQCLKGFKPKSPRDWANTDWSQGCEREETLSCTEGEGFVKFTGVRLPDTTSTLVNYKMNLEECRVMCLKNCSCMAYTNSDVRGGGSGCIMWFSSLVDIRQVVGGGQDLYIRMAASALDSKASSRMRARVIMIVCIALGATVSLLGLGGWILWKNRKPRDSGDRDDLELPLYNFDILKRATNDFSRENKLGAGGFGPVYKGILKEDQEIAVKRLSKDSIQGANEFKTEVRLISKLQHINLVRLLGCCIQGEEKLLVYEYMQHKSLDSYIFDETRRKQLDWQQRFQIILGIARGLLYLHHDSRLKIIHRDLKASNVLLDGEMVPKISDFGLARLFDGDQNEGRTTRVVGTYGYMSPEYAVDGYFSVKSDVYSFGVLVLEIISGRRNRSFLHTDHGHNLLGYAWRLWNDDKSVEMVDASIRGSRYVEDILRCIHIGLLCVQSGREQRPTMSSVVLMLSSETTVLPKPEKPGFYVERSTLIIEDLSIENEGLGVSSELSITLEAR